MSKALSLDLRCRVLAAVDDEGLSHRQAAARFQGERGQRQPLAKDAARKGRARAGAAGRRSQEPRDQRARRHHLRGLRRRARHEPGGTALCPGGARRHVRLRHLVALLPPPRLDSQKKTAHASEQDRPDILTRRLAWFDGQLDLDPERLVFVDETWASTNMARTHGRCPRGERLRMSVPHGHWTRRATPQA